MRPASWTTMNVPIAKSDGLPIGMMLIGEHRDDDKVLKAGYTIEKAGWYKGWFWFGPLKLQNRLPFDIAFQKQGHHGAAFIFQSQHIVCGPLNTVDSA